MLPSGDQLVARLSGGLPTPASTPPASTPAPSSFPFSLQPGSAAGGLQAGARADDLGNAQFAFAVGKFAAQDVAENWIQSGGPQRVMQESCMFKCGTAYLIGGGMGVAMGAFLAPFDSMNGLKVAENATAKEVAVATMHQTRTKAVSMGRTFAALGAIYSVTECVIEKYRAKTDLNNAVYAGCLTGGALARSAGPMGMAYGCGGFALWSVAMENFMHSDMMSKSMGGGDGD